VKARITKSGGLSGLRLKDRIRPGLRVLFVGINPGVRSALIGHHFAGYSNRFWKLLRDARLVPEPVTYQDDDRLPEWGLGLTNLIARATPGINELRPSEYVAGWKILDRKIRRYRPAVIAFTGVTLYRTIHPLLNGEAPRPDFGFDLSSPTFRPVRYVGPGQTTVLSLEEMRETATHPAITQMRITCDVIPQWPIELVYSPYDIHGDHLSLPPVSGTVPPITLGDVLFAIHRVLQTQITHLDWGRLSVSEEIAIARAYTRRCRSVPSIAQLEASQGVKRVDFLLDKFIFRGLVRDPNSHGFNDWKLIV